MLDDAVRLVGRRPFHDTDLAHGLAGVAKRLGDAGETVREIGVVERAPTDEADCIVEHADSLWRS